MIPIKIPWTSKPPTGTPIDLSHPFAKDLFFFSALDHPHDQLDLINNKVGVTVDTAGGKLKTRKPTLHGLAVNLQSANNVHTAGWDFGDTGGSGVYEPTAITIISRATVGEFYDNNGQRIVAKRRTVGGNDDWCIWLSTTSTEGDQFGFRVNGTTHFVSKASGNYEGHVVDVALSMSGGGTKDCYVWSVTDQTRDTNLGLSGGTVNTGTGNLCIGHRQAENRVWDGDIHYVALFNKPKNHKFINEFRRNPWQIFQPRTIWLPLDVGTTISGTITVTMGDVTSVTTGIVAIRGTSAVTLLGDTGVTTGGVETAGSIARTLEDDTQAATSEVTATGTIARTLEDDTGVTTANLGLTGSISRVLGDATATTTAELTALATLARTLGDDTQAATGEVGGAVAGTIASTLEEDTTAASGALEVTGSSTPTLEDDTSATAAALEISGATAETLDDDTGVTTASVGVSGAISRVLGDDTVASSGLLTVTGSIALGLDDDLVAASGLVGNAIAGTMAVTEGDDTVSSAGTLTLSGVMSSLLIDDTSAATGSMTIDGIATVGLDGDTLSGVGELTVTGSLTAILEAVGMSAIGIAGSVAGVPPNVSLVIQLDLLNASIVKQLDGSLVIATSTANSAQVAKVTDTNIVIKV